MVTALRFQSRLQARHISSRGSGKTVLTNFVAAKLGLVPIHADDYLVGDGRPYADQIRYETLKDDIDVHVSLGSGVIIDAICALW